MKYQLFVRPWRWILAGVWCLALAACDSEEAQVLRVASNQWPGYGALYWAREAGRLDERRIRLVEMPSAVEVIHGLRNGTIEAGLLTLDETLNLASEGIDLRVLLVLDVSTGGDALLARPGFADLADLKGKVVGVEASATGAIVLESALDEAGLSTDDIRIKSLGVKEQVAAYAQGGVDAVVCFEPNKSRLLAQGARVLFDSRQIPGRILDVLAVRTEVLDTQSRALRELIAAHFTGISALQTRPQESAALISPQLGMTPSALLTALGGLQMPPLEDNRRLLGGSKALNDLASQLSAYMIRKGLMAEGVDITHLPDDRFLPESAVDSMAVTPAVVTTTACGSTVPQGRSGLCAGER